VSAIVEVLLAFGVVHVGYRSFKHFTALGQVEVKSGLNFSAGTAMILFTLAMVLICRRSFAAYGLSLTNWRYNLNVGLLWAVFVGVAGGLVVALAPFRVDPLHPPDLQRALVFSVGELVLTLFLAVFLMKDRGLLGRVPPAVSLLVLAGFLAMPLLVAVVWQRPMLNVFLTVLWLFFGAGCGEEIFFRGYVQSRVNEAFGRPWTLLRVQFGPGLIVSSVLFGFIHALNPVDYFAGKFDFAWLWMIDSFCAGLFFGVLREKTGSVLPGAVVHGLEDVFGRILP